MREVCMNEKIIVTADYAELSNKKASILKKFSDDSEGTLCVTGKSYDLKNIGKFCEALHKKYPHLIFDVDMSQMDAGITLDYNNTKTLYFAYYIKKVILPDTIKVLNKYSVYYWRNEELLLPSGLVKIASKAIFRSSNMTFVIPAKTEIEPHFCDNQTYFNLTYSFESGSRYEQKGEMLIDNRTKTLLEFHTSDSVITIPEGIENIASDSISFQKEYLVMNLPKSVSHIYADTVHEAHEIDCAANNARLFIHNLGICYIPKKFSRISDSENYFEEILKKEKGLLKNKIPSVGRVLGSQNYISVNESAIDFYKQNKEKREHLNGLSMNNLTFYLSILVFAASSEFQIKSKLEGLYIDYPLLEEDLPEIMHFKQKAEKKDELRKSAYDANKEIRSRELQKIIAPFRKQLKIRITKNDIKYRFELNVKTINQNDDSEVYSGFIDVLESFQKDTERLIKILEALV